MAGAASMLDASTAIANFFIVFSQNRNFALFKIWLTRESKTSLNAACNSGFDHSWTTPAAPPAKSQWPAMHDRKCCIKCLQEQKKPQSEEKNRVGMTAGRRQIRIAAVHMATPLITRNLPKNPGPAGWNRLLPPAAASQTLSGDIMADWLIIGGGFAGLSAARRLTQLCRQG